jgi:hypothetical protein
VANLKGIAREDSFLHLEKGDQYAAAYRAITTKMFGLRQTAAVAMVGELGYSVVAANGPEGARPPTRPLLARKSVTASRVSRASSEPKLSYTGRGANR